jgi:ketosteroid isomerase-like protein
MSDKSMKIFLSLLAVLSIALSTTASATSEEQALKQMLNEFLAGASVNDIAAHERFWDDDLVYTSSGGRRFGKADILEGMESEETPVTDEPEVVYTAEDIRIRQYGDTAVVAFRLLGSIQDGSAAVLQYFNTGTFVKRHGEWQAVAWQATVIPEAE